MRVLQVDQVAGDPRGLGLVVLGLVVPHTLAVALVAPQALLVAVGVVADDRVRAPEHAVRGPIVLGERDDARAGELPTEVEDVPGHGAPPRVDALVVVAHDTQVPVARDQALKKAELGAVRVDHHVPESMRPPRRDGRVGLERLDREADQIVEVAPVHGPEPLLVRREHLRDDRVEGVHEGRCGGGEQALPMADPLNIATPDPGGGVSDHA